MDIKKPVKSATKTTVGSPKKASSGGRGGWGKAGLDDLNLAKASRDDPDFDSDEEREQSKSVVIHDVPVVQETAIEKILREFFVSAVESDVAESLKDEDVSNVDFIRKALYLSMEQQAFERESVSKLLCYLRGSSVTPNQFEEAFQIALDKLDDSMVDIPLAAEMLSKFIARAIVDEVIPPYVLKLNFADSKNANETLAQASRLVNDPHRSRKLEHIWGPGDLVSVKRLKQEVHKIIQEYLSTEDKAEADHSLRKLNAPSFHFQLVRYAIRAAIDTEKADNRRKILDLLTFFVKQGLSTEDSVTRGFECYRTELEDHRLDVPSANIIFNELVHSAQDRRILSADFK